MKMVNKRKEIGDYIFISKYAQTDNGVKETWHESIDRVMDMNVQHLAGCIGQSGLATIDKDLSLIKKLYQEQRILGSQRALQYGGPAMIKHNLRLYNCFKKETEFITSTGVKSFADFDNNDEITVLTAEGNWKNAIVKSYGTQPLKKITFRRANNFSVVYATENHRWLLTNDKETTNLKVGDQLKRLPCVHKGFNFDTASIPEKLYWCYGFIYGDGTVSGVHSMVRLCDQKRRFKDRFHEMGFKSSSSLSIKGDLIFYTGTYQKTLPDPKVDSPELIRAFVNGYLCADGSANNNSTPDNPYIGIQCHNEEGAEFIRKCFPIAGVYVVSEKYLPERETNLGKAKPAWVFRLVENIGQYSQPFTVESIEDAGEEEVWCLEVEDDHSFVLPNGITTGNCSGSYVNRISFFQELMYLLLCGCGSGYSVQKVHANQLPKVKGVDLSRKMTVVIDDSIEGWAYAVNNLVESHYFGLPQVEFDYSKIRKRGSFISGGFKAPGPEPLRKCLSKMDKVLRKIRGRKATPFELHRLNCMIADAVISGGIRRAALSCQFDADDDEMLMCKTGNWFSEFPELARSNNSAIILPSTPREIYERVFLFAKEYGEPGVIFSFHPDVVFNPCVEVSGYPQIRINGEIQYGWFFCNLTEINGAKIKTKEDFFTACEGASMLGTIQASYTDFKVLSPASKAIAERDALIGVGITGMCENPEILFDPEIQRTGATIVKQANKYMSKRLGINFAARCTVIKPSGNSSQLLGCTSSGIHEFPFKRFIRNIQAANTEQALDVMKKVNPFMVRPSAYNKDIESVISFPVELPENVLTSEHSTAINFLKRVKLTKENWIESGTNYDHPFYSDYPGFEKIRMNVSNTVCVGPNEWDEVRDYLWDNKDVFAGVSFLSRGGDLIYPQAPYTSVLDEKELAERYGAGAILAGGLIIDGLSVFEDDLWLACDVAMGRNDKHLTLTDYDISSFILSHLKDGKLLVNVNGVMISDVNAISSHLKSTVEKKVDWVRRFKKFADKYLEGDLFKTECCLKHVSLFHRWQKLKEMKPINWNDVLWETQLIDAGSTVGAACSSGSCEL